MNPEHPFGGEYILGGKVLVKQENFCLKIWAKRELTDEEILHAFDAWRAAQPKDFQRRDKTLHVLTENGVIGETKSLTA